MLADDVDDLLPQLVALGQFRALLDVGRDDERTHGRGQLVMLVGTAELVLDEVFGIGQLARVMIQGASIISTIVDLIFK